mmetsp:Transcript_90470/g.230081  ORF Transcript_90470/g.230081 Transcript_90470/m.230081 type:complete len:259 (-) Transcript_90470:1-777(-)
MVDGVVVELLWVWATDTASTSAPARCRREDDDKETSKAHHIANEDLPDACLPTAPGEACTAREKAGDDGPVHRDSAGGIDLIRKHQVPLEDRHDGPTDLDDLDPTDAKLTESKRTACTARTRQRRAHHSHEPSKHPLGVRMSPTPIHGLAPFEIGVQHVVSDASKAIGHALEEGEQSELSQQAPKTKLAPSHRIVGQQCQGDADGHDKVVRQVRRLLDVPTFKARLVQASGACFRHRLVSLFEMEGSGLRYRYARALP